MAKKSRKTPVRKSGRSASLPFNRLRRDEDGGGYCQTVLHRDRKVEVRILAESNEELRDLLPCALRFWRSRARWFKAFRDYAVDELLSPLNDALDWGQDHPPVVTAGELRRMLPAPFSVVIGRDDDGQTYFEMSGGADPALHEHCLEVSGTQDEGITDGGVVALF